MLPVEDEGTYKWKRKNKKKIAFGSVRKSGKSD